MQRTPAPMFNENRLKLGTFSANCSGGMAVTKVPERWNNDWANNLDLVKQCDDAGIEFMLPIARWIGYGGETDFHGNVLETVTWAAGLAAHSKTFKFLPLCTLLSITPLWWQSNSPLWISFPTGESA